MRKSIITIMCLVVLFSFSTTAMAAVAYLGPAGTFSEEVTKYYFNDPKETFEICSDVKKALQLLTDKKVEYAVIPVENTLGGIVYNYLDQVLANKNLQVVAELNLPIRQQLFVLPGSKLSDIKTIYSHPQGFAQSRTWLNKYLPAAKQIEVNSTAEAVRLVEEKQDKSIAGIAGPQAGKIYKVQTLAEDLQISRKNITRFWVVKLKNEDIVMGKKDNNTKAAVYIKATADDTARLLQDLIRQGMIITAIHDRPAKTNLGEYNYLIELDKKSEKNSLKDILKTSRDTIVYDILGTYNSIYY